MGHRHLTRWDLETRMSNTTVTRRAALRSGGLAAIAAGLLGTGKPEPVAAAPQTVVINADDLAAECQRLYAEMLAAQAAHVALEQPIEAALGFEEMSAYADIGTTHTVAREQWIVSELVRHL